MKRFLSFLICFISLCTFATANDSTAIYVKMAKEMIAEENYYYAESYFKKAIKTAPTDYSIQNQLAALYVEKMGKLATALAIYSNVIAHDPNNQEAIEEFIILKLKHKKAEEILGVIDNLKTPKKININEVKGKCLYLHNEYVNAIPYLEKATKEFPKKFDVNFYYAQCLNETDDFKKAITYYEKAIRIDSTKANSIYNVAIAYYNKQAFDKATQLLDIAAANGVRQDNDFKSMYGSALLASGNLVKGKKYMDEVIASNPNDQKLLYEVAQDFYFGKQYELAIDYWTRLLKLNKTNYRALYMTGLCYKKLGDDKQGNLLCDRAIEYDPSLKNLRQVPPTAPQFGL